MTRWYYRVVIRALTYVDRILCPMDSFLLTTLMKISPARCLYSLCLSVVFKFVLRALLLTHCSLFQRLPTWSFINSPLLLDAKLLPWHKVNCIALLCWRTHSNHLMPSWYHGINLHQLDADVTIWPWLLDVKLIKRPDADGTMAFKLMMASPLCRRNHSNNLMPSRLHQPRFKLMSGQKCLIA